MKKKILAIVLCVAMLAIAIVGGTMAYFTDTKAQTNTFTAGSVKIGLDEAVVEKNGEGNYVAVAAGTRTHNDQSYHLYPGMSVVKDPTIYVQPGSEDAYIAAKITITSGEAGDLEKLIYSTDHYQHLLDVSKIINGGIAAPGATMKTDHPLMQKYPHLPVYGDATYSAFQEVGKNGDEYTGEYVIYVFIENPMKAGESITLFNEMVIPADWDNGEMEIMHGATIHVKAFGTQTNGFDNCYDAITAAFAEEFNFA